jgi:alpha-L-fucosidase
MAETDMPWMVIYPLGRSFSFEIQARYHKSAAWVIRNLIQCVATGGNFMVGIGPDADGWFHPKAIEVLETVGEWLKINGEAVYATRPFTPWHEPDLEHPGEDIHFSQAKDGRTVYAFCQGETWRAVRRTGRLRLASIPAREGLQVTLLGGGTPLAWREVGATGRSPILEMDVPKAASTRLGMIGGVVRFQN